MGGWVGAMGVVQAPNLKRAGPGQEYDHGRIQIRELQGTLLDSGGWKKGLGICLSSWSSDSR